MEENNVIPEKKLIIGGLAEVAVNPTDYDIGKKYIIFDTKPEIGMASMIWINCLDQQAVHMPIAINRLRILSDEWVLDRQFVTYLCRMGVTPSKVEFNYFHEMMRCFVAGVSTSVYQYRSNRKDQQETDMIFTKITNQLENYWAMQKAAHQKKEL